MAKEPKTLKQHLLFILLVAYFILGFMPLNEFNHRRGFFHMMDLPGEENLPFIVHFIFGYSLVYASIFLIYWVIPSWRTFKKMAWGFFLITTIHYIIFLVYPVRMVWRPEITEIHNASQWLAWLIFSLDRPNNCFPSLHVAYPTLTTVLAWKYIPRWKWFFCGMAIITAVSVVLVKQHYILDAVAGAVVSILVGLAIANGDKNPQNGSV